ncbi:MAG: hypothetical protein AAGH78_12395 [Cyanobacteria bacterium P01_H01_bin.58]
MPSGIPRQAPSFQQEQAPSQSIKVGAASSSAEVLEATVTSQPQQNKLPVFTSRVLPGHGDSVDSVAFSPDGQRIVSGSFDRTIRLWDLEGNSIGQPFHGHSGRCRHSGLPTVPLPHLQSMGKRCRLMFNRRNSISTASGAFKNMLRSLNCDLLS